MSARHTLAKRKFGINKTRTTRQAPFTLATTATLQRGAHAVPPPITIPNAPPAEPKARRGPVL